RRACRRRVASGLAEKGRTSGDRQPFGLAVCDCPQCSLNVLNKPQRTNLFFLDLTDTVYRLQVRDPEQELIYKESLNRINEAIAALPPRCKMIFRLVREDG